ncbi:thioredoxin [Atopobium deltae]|uniref:Thioredoxin n=2 Tax=Atopobium deltae TaxID=1393034 RepID=A0A133XWI0_9ACTN|nr:thioredoxin [Atopobium deltae]
MGGASFFTRWAQSVQGCWGWANGGIMATQRLTSAAFEASVVNNTKPVLVDFWASWCGPCRALGPVIEEVSDELSDLIDVYKCNVDDEADLATKFHIVSIPTLILFKDGQAIHTMVGNMPKADLIKEIKQQL